MAKEITTISPEGLEVANSYLTLGNIRGVCEQLQVDEKKVVDTLNKREVKKYIDTVYLDTGYRTCYEEGPLHSSSRNLGQILTFRLFGVSRYPE